MPRRSRHAAACSGRRWFALIMGALVVFMLALGIGLVHAPSALGATYNIGSAAWVRPDKSYVQFTDAQGNVITPDAGTTLDYGDAFKMHLEFSVPNGTMLQNGDTLIYDLPAGITYESGQTYPMTDASGAQLGSYVIRGNQVVITYTGQSGASNISGFVTIEGTVTSNNSGGNTGGPTQFEFPGYGEVDVELNPRHDLNVVKNGAISVPGHPDLWDFVLDVESIGTNANVHLTDTMGEYLHLYTKDAPIIVCEDPACRTQLPADAWELTRTTDHGFNLTITSMTDMQKYYVKYRVRIDRRQAVQACKNGWECTQPGNPKYDSVNNTVHYSSEEHAEKKTTEKGIWLDSQWAVSKRGTDATDAAGVKIYWTMEIWPGEDGVVDGATVKDTLGDHLGAPEADPTVTCYARGAEYYPPIDCGSVTWKDLADGTATLPVPEGGAGYARYVITYTTPIDDGGSARTYTNDVTVTPDPNKDGHDPQHVTGTGRVEDPTAISKVFLSASENDQKLHWMTVFTTKRAVDGATVTDTLDVDSRGENHGPLQELDADSIRITTDREGRHEWNGTPMATETSDSGFTLTFGALPAGTTLYIFYTSTLPNPPNGKTLYNTASDGTHKSTAQHETVGENMTKGGWQNGSGTIIWRLQVHDVNPNATSVEITDTLPENLGYVPGSFVALDNPYYPRAPQNGVQVQDNGDGTLTFSITPGTPAFQEATTADGLYLEYTTKIIDYAAAKQAGRKEYKNSAHIAVNGVIQPDRQAGVWIDPPGVLDKTGNYNAATAPNIEYTVRVNEGGLTLNGGRTLILTDTLGEALAVRLDSVAIRNPDNSELAGATYAYNPQTRELVFRVPDGTPCLITYKATVQLAAGETFGETNGGNTVVLTGSGEKIADDETKQTGEVEETKGGLTSSDHMLQVFKYVDHDVNSPLAGVQFDIVALNVEDKGHEIDGAIVTVKAVQGVNGDIPAAVVSTNSAGYTEGAGLRADTIYRVTERQSAGYVGIDPLYIVFPGPGSAGSYAGVRVLDDGKTYPLTVATMASHVWMCNNDHELEVSLNLGKTDELGNPLTGATLQLTRADGTVVGNEWTSDGTMHTIDGLTPGTYLLVEKRAPEGYARADDVTIRVNADGTIIVDGKNVAQGGGQDISADVTMRDTPTTTSVRAKKIWDDANNQDGLRKDAVFDLYRKVGGGAWQLVPGQSRTIPADATGAQLSVAWASLPTRAAGEPVEYRVQEREIDGYTSNGVLQDGVWTFTNTHTPATTRVRVHKVWDDEDNADQLRPGAVTMRLYADGEPVQGGERVLSAENAWEVEFSGLPKYANGQPIAYTVTEVEALTGYVVHYSYATGEGGGRTVTVTNTHEPQTSDLRIAKQNIVGEQIAGARLRIDGTDAEGRAITPIEWTSQADGPLPVTLALPPHSAQPQEHMLGPGEYTLREIAPPDGYTAADPIAFTVTHENGEWHVARANGGSMEGNRIVMTDRYRTTPVPISKRTLTGTVELPGAQLELSGTRVDGTSVTPFTWTSGSEPRSINLLPGEYTLREVAAPSGYERAQDVVFRVHVGGAVEVLSGGTLSGGAVTMRDAVRTMSVFFSKTAVGSPVQLPGAQFELAGTTVDGTPVGEQWTSSGEMHELTLADGTYTLTETQAPDGYEPVAPITVIVRDGRLIVDEIVQEDAVVRVENELTPRTAVSVMKQWQDNGDADKLRPQRVQVQLMAGDKPYGDEVTLSATNNWTVTWADLPKLGADGEEVDYTIREILNGEYGDAYHVSLRETHTTDGVAYNLVNIHQPDAVELRLAKHWDDANDQDGKRPGQVGVSIWGVVQPDGGEPIKTQLVDVPDLRPEDGLLSADGNTWQWHLYGLPKFDAQNRPYSFELRETGAAGDAGGAYELVTGEGTTCDNDGHCTPTPGSDADGKPALIEFTNRHEPETVSVHVGKTWIDRDNADGTRPGSLAVWLLSSVWDQSNGWPTPQYGFSSKQDVTFTELKNPFTESIPADKLLENGDWGECVKGSYAYGRSCLVLTPSTEQEDRNKWNGEFTDLPKYYRGQLIRYVVTEQQVDGYDASLVIGDGGESGAITCADCSDGNPAVGLTGESASPLQFQLINQRQMELPSTGGAGMHHGLAAGFMIMAVALMGGAGALARGSRCKEGVQ